MNDLTNLDTEVAELLGAPFDLYAAAERHGVSEQNARMIHGLMRGLSQTNALKAAGHTAEGLSLRKAASKAASGTRFRALLKEARDAQAALPPGPAKELTDAEKLDGLAKIFRTTSNELSKIRAEAAHTALCEKIERAKTVEEKEFNPLEFLRGIAAYGEVEAELADRLSHRHGLHFTAAEIRAPQKTATDAQPTADAEETTHSAAKPNDGGDDPAPELNGVRPSISPTDLSRGPWREQPQN